MGFENRLQLFGYKVIDKQHSDAQTWISSKAIS